MGVETVGEEEDAEKETVDVSYRTVNLRVLITMTMMSLLRVFLFQTVGWIAMVTCP